jgi:hypothetical protein
MGTKLTNFISEVDSQNETQRPVQADQLCRQVRTLSMAFSLISVFVKDL